MLYKVAVRGIVGIAGSSFRIRFAISILSIFSFIFRLMKKFTFEKKLMIYISFTYPKREIFT